MSELPVTVSGLGDLTIPQLFAQIHEMIVNPAFMTIETPFDEGGQVRKYERTIGTTDLTATTGLNRTVLSIWHDGERIQLTEYEDKPGAIMLYVPLGRKLFGLF